MEADRRFCPKQSLTVHSMIRAKRLGRADNMFGLDRAHFSACLCALPRFLLVPRLGPTVQGVVLILTPGLMYLNINGHTGLGGDHLVSSSADVHAASGVVENADAIMGELCAPTGSEQPILVVLIFRRC